MYLLNKCTYHKLGFNAFDFTEQYFVFNLAIVIHRLHTYNCDVNSLRYYDCIEIIH
jgi:hypothetical protein